ncbi:MAG: hypothetical protein WA814_12745 [Candidatus Baltobacteraceae bacterium]
MLRGSRRRVVPLAGACALAVVLSGTPAPAAIDMYVGARTVVQNQPVSSCSLKAKTALNAVLQDAVEAGETNQWQAYGPPDSSGHASAGAAIHCYPLDNGYVVTFTCAVETPPNTGSASDLCAKLTTAFGS